MWHHWLTFLQANDLATFLNPYLKPKDSSLSSRTFNFIFKGKQKSSLIFFTGLLNTPLPVWLLFISSLFWCQQHYSSAWRTPSGALVEVVILWNCLKNPSHYMLRVEWERRQRQKLICWEMFKDGRLWILMQGHNFSSLLLNVISVRFIVSICTWHI